MNNETYDAALDSLLHTVIVDENPATWAKYLPTIIALCSLSETTGEQLETLVRILQLWGGATIAELSRRNDPMAVPYSSIAEAHREARRLVERWYEEKSPAPMS